MRLQISGSRDSNQNFDSNQSFSPRDPRVFRDSISPQLPISKMRLCKIIHPALDGKFLAAWELLTCPRARLQLLPFARNEMGLRRAKALICDQNPNLLNHSENIRRFLKMSCSRDTKIEGLAQNKLGAGAR